jgi:hypothetical protein
MHNMSMFWFCFLNAALPATATPPKLYVSEGDTEVSSGYIVIYQSAIRVSGISDIYTQVSQIYAEGPQERMPVASRCVRCLQGTAMWIHGTVVCIHGTVMWIHGTAMWIQCTAMWIHGTIMWMHVTAIWIHGTVMWIHGTAIDLHSWHCDRSAFMALRLICIHGTAIDLHSWHCDRSAFMALRSICIHGTAIDLHSWHCDRSAFMALRSICIHGTVIDLHSWHCDRSAFMALRCAFMVLWCEYMVLRYVNTWYCDVRGIPWTSLSTRARYPVTRLVCRLRTIYASDVWQISLFILSFIITNVVRSINCWTYIVQMIPYIT